MSTSAPGLGVRPGRPLIAGASLRTYFADSPQRTTQTVLGLIWLLDGALQFQSFMYSGGFVSLLKSTAAGEPGWVHASVFWAANLAAHDLTLWNTLFALVQVAIGIGLLLRPAVRPALMLSFAWAIVVWWIGNSFGGILNSTAMPLTGAPGAVLLYGLIGLVAWPSERPGGVLGVRGARTMWCALWLVMAALWLEASSAAPNAIHDAINAAPSGMSWLSSLQDGFAAVARGNGVAISLILAAASAAIAIGVGANRFARQLLILSAVLNLVYWLVGQGLGGIFAGGATDPNAGPLFILLAYAIYSLTPHAPAPGDPNRRTAP